MKKVMVYLTAVLLAFPFLSALGEADVSGYYDALLEIDNEAIVLEELNIILTPQGHGRLIMEDSSGITFDYTVQNGDITTDFSDFTMKMLEDDRILVLMDDMEFPFQKRADIRHDPMLTGTWRTTAMTKEDVSISQTFLEALGLSIEMTAYDSGAIDWQAKSDKVSNVAQGWGVDEQGLYFKNGTGTHRIIINGDALELVFSDGDSMTFARQ